jgi:hypothetical protein
VRQPNERSDAPRRLPGELCRGGIRPHFRDTLADGKGEAFVRRVSLCLQTRHRGEWFRAIVSGATTGTPRCHTVSGRPAVQTPTDVSRGIPSRLTPVSNSQGPTSCRPASKGRLGIDSERDGWGRHPTGTYAMHATRIGYLGRPVDCRQGVGWRAVRLPACLWRSTNGATMYWRQEEDGNA